MTSSKLGELRVRLATLLVSLDRLRSEGIVLGLAVADEEKMHSSSLPASPAERRHPGIGVTSDVGVGCRRPFPTTLTALAEKAPRRG